MSPARPNDPGAQPSNTADADRGVVHSPARPQLAAVNLANRGWPRPAAVAVAVGAGGVGVALL